MGSLPVKVFTANYIKHYAQYVKRLQAPATWPTGLRWLRRGWPQHNALA
jgi:hypothetical protein